MPRPVLRIKALTRNNQTLLLPLESSQSLGLKLWCQGDKCNKGDRSIKEGYLEAAALTQHLVRADPPGASPQIPECFCLAQISP